MRLLLHRGLHLFTLGTLAIAYPLFGLIRMQPQFLSAHGTTPVQTMAMIVLLCLGIPGILFAVEALLEAWNSRAASAAHAVIVSAFFALLAMPPLTRWSVPGIVVLLTAVAFGLFAGYLYWKHSNVRSFVTLLCPALIVVPWAFVTSPGVKGAMNSQPPIFPVYSGPPPSHSVLVLVLDEFPLVSLLDGPGRIDAERYPQIAAFAGESTWYRNATTNADGTLLSVPAMMTGKYPDFLKTPTLKHHPENVIAYFSKSFQLTVFESLTQLRPPSPRAPEPAHDARFRLLMKDLAAVFLQVILPDDLRMRLPSVEQTWTGFWDSTGSKSEESEENPMYVRRKTIESMIQSLKGVGKQPSFHYFHLMLPHLPLEYFPSGRSYDGRSFGPNGIDGVQIGDGWQNQEQPVLRAYQRHLLQAMYTDKVVGRILETLKAERRYDDTLVVLTSDHGLSFVPGHNRRRVEPESIGGLVPIPLFIKYPGQTLGKVETGNVELVDVAPTIADVIGAPLPWKTDGVSLAQTPAPARVMQSVMRHSDGRWFHFRPESIRAALERHLQRKISLFGSGSESALYAINGSPEWIGRSVSDLHISGDSPYRVWFKYGDPFSNVDPDRDPLPCLIRGRFVEKPAPSGSLRIAIALNGRIEAITRDEQTRDFPKLESISIFAALVPENAFRPGRNQVEILLMKENSGGNDFQRIAIVP